MNMKICRAALILCCSLVALASSGATPTNAHNAINSRRDGFVCSNTACAGQSSCSYSAGQVCTLTYGSGGLGCTQDACGGSKDPF